MIEFEIKSRVQPIGERKGQTVYFAAPKSQQKITNEMVINHIVDETALSEGDVKSALATLGKFVSTCLQQGSSVDLAELGSFRLVVSSKMMDTPEEVTVKNALNTPKIAFTPKQRMRETAAKVTLSIDRSTVTKADSTPSGGDGGDDDSTQG